MKTSRSGICLVEIMIIIAIIAILAAMLLPAICAADRQEKFNQQARTYQHDATIYQEGFNDGVNLVIQHGHWTGTNVVIDVKDFAHASKY